MKQLTLATSVPDWLVAFPQLLTVFEELNIDCCCGRKSLEHACEERGLNPQATMTYLQSVLLRSQGGEFL
ncbi:MAG: DUF542 domain-containing protein [Planctomycetota bacterium]